jgi:hypothetical protein
MTDPHQPDAEIHARLDKALADKAEADARAAAAKADQAETEAAVSRYSALVPDLSKVNTGTLDVEGTDATLASGLAFAAVTDAATLIAKKIAGRVGAGKAEAMKVVVTGDADLVQGGAIYLSLLHGLQQLLEQAKRLGSGRPATPAPPPGAALLAETGLAAGAALAPAVAGVLSLLARHETLTRAAVKADDLAAASAVAGALIEHAHVSAVMHDTFRIAKPGVIDGLAKQLADRLPALRRVTEPPAAEDAAALIKAITAALGQLNAVPKGGGRSPLAVASLYELMAGAHPKMSHALLVKGLPGSAGELVDQRFIGKDRIALSVSMSIAYMFIDTITGNIVAAGTETATVGTHGSLKDSMRLHAGMVEHLAAART